MANLDVSNVFGYVDKRRGQGTAVDPAAATMTNLKDVASMRARLTAISATTYTATRLDQMTHNDMRYAIRLSDDSASGVNG